MHHSYIDKYADLESPVHGCEPLIKVILSFLFVFAVVLTAPGAYLLFIFYGFLMSVLLVFSKIPPLFIFKKTLTVIPFVVLIALYSPFLKGSEGIVLFFGILIKSYLSVFSVALLVSTTRLDVLLKTLERLKVPGIFIMIMSFMYRYLFLFIDESQRMQRARESRISKPVGRLATVRSLANIIGVLFIRSYERAERIYLSMCSRGFSGDIKIIDWSWKKS